MEEEPMQQVLGKVLRDAETAWYRKDFEALQRASEEVPGGYTLCVFSFRDGDPSFCVFAVEELHTLPGGFKCLDPDEFAARCALEAEPETSSEPDGSTLEIGLPGSVQPDEESGRGNL